MESSSKSLAAVSSPPSETIDLLPSGADSQLSNLVYDVSLQVQLAKFNVVFVMGAPGSGKSTQCRKIAHLYGFTHLSPGDLLQTETGSRSEYSTIIHTMIQNIMNEGKLVPSELTVKLLRRAMHKTAKYKFVVDGFPCDKENLAEWKNAMGIEPKLVLYFGCSEEVVVSRLKNEVREDDLDTLRKRFKLFSKDSPSLIEHFGSNGTLKNINAERSVEEVFEEIKVIFSQKDMDIDVDDCQLNEAYLDVCDLGQMEALAAQSQYTALGKRKSELPPTKKMRKHLVGPVKRSIRLSLKELGVKNEDFSYLDGLTPEDYLQNLRNVVIRMAGSVDDAISPIPMQSTRYVIGWDNMSIIRMADLGMKEVEGTFYCANCKTIEKAKIDWREGYVCLASYLLGKMVRVGMCLAPSNKNFRVRCSSCYKELLPSSVNGCWNFLFLALTHSVLLCPRDEIMGYLRGLEIEISENTSEDMLLMTFYIAIITQLDPSNIGWNYLRCLAAGAIGNGENA